MRPREVVRHLVNRKGVHRISPGVAQQVYDEIDDEWIDVENDIAVFPTQV